MSTKIHKHPLLPNPNSPDETTTALAIQNAKELLSTRSGTSTLALWRRLQFGEFLPTSFLLTNLDLPVDEYDSLASANASATATSSVWSPPEPYVLAFVDRARRPETEVYASCSWEYSDSDGTPEMVREQQGQRQRREEEEGEGLLRDLILAIKYLGTPASIHQDALDAETEETKVQTTTTTTTPQTDHAGFSKQHYGGHASNPSIALWGSVHERTQPILERLGVLNPEYNTAMLPNHHFFFDVDALATPKPLPPGLRWGEMRPAFFPLVRSRTMIPRQERTMAICPSLAIYPIGTTARGEGEDNGDSDDDKVAPVAWAFIGLDSSLTTLHVEPEWRGHGLAKTLSTKLFREKMDRFWVEGKKPRLAHAKVIAGNEQSVGVCKSLGGVSDHDAYWLRVDLSKI